MQQLQPNTTLQGGKYRIERVLGQGGFGITYLARQTSLQRLVAIKEFFIKDFCVHDDATLTMKTRMTGNNSIVSRFKNKFVKEARNLAKLNHTHIVSIIDVFEENGTVYYAMPYLSGGSLQDYVSRHGALSEQEAMKYIKQVANALKYMHEEKHICHFDVKPSNILLDNKGNAVLIDFGISKNYDSTGRETTTTPLGISEGYSPIEQYQQNVEEFSPESDVYALGATLYFLLHGVRPESAPSRAAGTALMMRKALSPSIKNIINASLKISKHDRAKSVRIFLDVARASTQFGSNAWIKIVVVFVILVIILGIVAINTQSPNGADNLKEPSVEQTQETVSSDDVTQQKSPLEQNLESCSYNRDQICDDNYNLCYYISYPSFCTRTYPNESNNYRNVFTDGNDIKIETWELWNHIEVDYDSSDVYKLLQSSTDTYHCVKSKWVVVSGKYANGKKYYCKAVFNKNDDVIYAKITYSDVLSESIEKQMINQIFNNFPN